MDLSIGSGILQEDPGGIADTTGVSGTGVMAEGLQVFQHLVSPEEQLPMF